MRTLLALLLAVSASAQSIDYRFDAVRRNVFVSDKPVTAGVVAHSGDKVKTGWFSYALLAADKHRAKFELFSATDVTLAEGTAGVILSVDRGRIRAAFDKITGSEPRVVKTPGALLAVRGTRFDVEVDQEGNAIVDVFEGVVEVQSPLRAEPLFVRAGEESRFGRSAPPTVHRIPDHRRRMAPEGTMDHDGGGHQGGDQRNQPGEHHGSGQKPPQQTPQQPHHSPHKPPV